MSQQTLPREDVTIITDLETQLEREVPCAIEVTAHGQFVGHCQHAAQWLLTFYDVGSFPACTSDKDIVMRDGGCTDLSGGWAELSAVWPL